MSADSACKHYTNELASLHITRVYKLCSIQPTNIFIPTLLAEVPAMKEAYHEHLLKFESQKHKNDTRNLQVLEIAFLNKGVTCKLCS